MYEHITYDNRGHVSLASLPDMQSRTVITSSLSKTYSVTGTYPAQKNISRNKKCRVTVQTNVFDRVESRMGNSSDLHCLRDQKHSYQNHRFCSCTFSRSCFGCSKQPSCVFRIIEKCKVFSLFAMHSSSISSHYSE